MPRVPKDFRLDPPVPALHPERDALLAAVRDADPADDLPALVYADWQDEHGQPEHAELIRVMCELGRLKPRAKATKAQRSTLLRRVTQLFKTPALEPLRDMTGVRDRYRRGFVRDFRPCVYVPDFGYSPLSRQTFAAPDQLDMPAFVPFDKVARATLLLPPGLSLAITEPLAKHPWLRRFQGIGQLTTWFGRWIAPGTFEPLLAAGNLCNIETFEVDEGRIAGDELVRFYLHRSTANLRELQLGQLEQRVTPPTSHQPSWKAFLAAVEQIVSSRKAKRLAALGNEFFTVDEALAGILLASPHLPDTGHQHCRFGKITAKTRARLNERFTWARGYA